MHIKSGVVDRLKKKKKTFQVLEKDFFHFVKGGEGKKDFDFIFKATVINRKYKEK